MPLQKYDIREGRLTFIASSLILPLYRQCRSETLRSALRNLTLRLEDGPMHSLTIREIFRRFHGVDVGLYTLGPCEDKPDRLGNETVVGRYSSIYWTAQAVPRLSLLSSKLPTSITYDRVSKDEKDGKNPSSKLVIGNDVFVGHNAIILPSVERIGDGAFIGAGSVVHANVPAYAVVTGNPARVVRYRFSEGKIKELLESKWWLKPLDELCTSREDFLKPLEGDTVR